MLTFPNYSIVDQDINSVLELNFDKRNSGKLIPSLFGSTKIFL